MTPPLRKTTTNPMSVTVSTGDAAFLLLPLPHPTIPCASLAVSPQPQAGWLAPLLGPAPPACMPAPQHSHRLLSLPLPPRFLQEESKPGGWGGGAAASPPWVLYSSLWAYPTLYLPALFHSASLRCIPYFLVDFRDSQTKA